MQDHSDEILRRVKERKGHCKEGLIFGGMNFRNHNPKSLNGARGTRRGLLTILKDSSTFD